MGAGGGERMFRLSAVSMVWSPDSETKIFSWSKWIFDFFLVPTNIIILFYFWYPIFWLQWANFPWPHRFDTVSQCLLIRFPFSGCAVFLYALRIPRYELLRACCNLLELAANLSIFIYSAAVLRKSCTNICVRLSPVGVLIVVLTLVPLSALSGLWKAAGRIRSVCSGNQDIVLPRAQSLPPRKKNWWICFVTLNSVPCIIHLQFIALGSLFMFLRIFLWNV